MTAQDYISVLRSCWPIAGSGGASAETLRLADEAVTAFGNSPKLWCMRGDLIQLGDVTDDKYTLPDALRSYQAALEVDPTFAQAHESIGYYYDVIDIDLDRSLAAFKAAVQFGGGVSSYFGLARVLAECGTADLDVLLLINNSPYKHDPILQEIRTQLLEGLSVEPDWCSKAVT